MKNTYLSQKIKIIKIEKLTADVMLFTFDYKFPKFIPGQFVMLGVLGFGEAPFGIMQPACESGKLQLLIRKVGILTSKIFELSKDDHVFVRGPLGNGFPINELRGKNLTLFAGGTGIVPIKAMLDYISIHRHYFKEIQIFYGAKTPEALFFQNELNACQKFSDVLLTCEIADKSWRGNTGLITSLMLPKTTLSENAVSLLCGPPIMYKFVIDKLKKLGYKNSDVYVSLERRIRCGIGKCQHCTCGEEYVCLDGPVFRYDKVLTMPDGI